MLQKIKFYKKAVLIFVCWVIVLCEIPHAYYGGTKKQIENEMTAEYEMAVDAEYNALLAQYEQDQINYEEDLIEYATDCDA